MHWTRKISLYLALIGAFVALAFLGCLVLLRVGGIYVSPDETANAFFAKTFVRDGSLSVHEQASECRFAQHRTERVEALLEDALPVGHEEEGIDGPSAEPPLRRRL